MTDATRGLLRLLNTGALCLKRFPLKAPVQEKHGMWPTHAWRWIGAIGGHPESIANQSSIASYSINCRHLPCSPHRKFPLDSSSFGLAPESLVLPPASWPQPGKPGIAAKRRPNEDRREPALSEVSGYREAWPSPHLVKPHFATQHIPASPARMR